jgi:hypothetical protein
MNLEICQEVKKEKKRIKNSQKCIAEDCSKYSTFNLKGLKAQFCNLLNLIIVKREPALILKENHLNIVLFILKKE